MNTLPEPLAPEIAEIRHARIPLDRITADVGQVRTQFEPKALKKLADSLRIDGQLQPAIVFEEDGRYVVIAGERRLKAARLAGLDVLDCIIFPHRPTPADSTRLQLIENVLRQDLDPIDKANGYRRLMEQEGLQASQLAERLHLAKSTVGRSLALLQLPFDLQEQIHKGTPLPTVAREGARLPDEERRRQALGQIASEKLTATQAAKLVSTWLKPKKAKAPRRDRKTYKLAGYEAVITPMRVILAPTGQKRGRTADDMLAALMQLIAKLQEDMAGRAVTVATEPVAMTPSIH